MSDKPAKRFVGQGGPGRGGGRRKGQVSKKTKMLREIGDKALAAGITPLEVMLENMRFYHSRAEELLQEISVSGKSNVTELKELLGLRQLAGEAAKDAAPYTSPRLAAIQHTGLNGGPIRTVNEGMTPQQAAEAYASTLKGE